MMIKLERINIILKELKCPIISNELKCIWKYMYVQDSEDRMQLSHIII